MPAPIIEHGVAVADVAGDGITDDYSSIHQALNSGMRAVFIPPKTCRVSQGLEIPAGVELFSVGFEPGNPASGCVLLFDASVVTCITLGNGTDNATRSMRGIVVSRESGTIPSTSIGVKVFGGYNVQLDQVMSHRQAVGFEFKAVGVMGISAHCISLFTGTISTHHVVADTWPELYVTDARFGQNGLSDLESTSFVYIMGGGIGGAGPNTVSFSQCQFNQGSALVKHFIHIGDLINPGSNALEFRFTNCHIEGLSEAVFYSVEGTELINRLQLDNCVYNTPNVPFWTLHPSTRLADFQASNQLIYALNFNLAPTQQVDFLQFDNIRISGPTRLEFTANSTVLISNSTFAGPVEVGGAANISFANSDFINGISFLSGRTGRISITGSDPQTIGVGLAFDGETTGISYLYAGATWQFVGAKIEVDFRILLTSKGTSTGVASLTGLPHPVDQLREGGAGGAVLPYITNMVGLAGPVSVTPSAGTTEMGFYQFGSNGIALLTDENFTDDSVLFGNFAYYF